MARYRFVTTWVVEAPIERVWDAVYAAERWPEWWPSVVRAVKLSEGDENDIGCVWSFAWRSDLPYTLEFESETTRVDRPFLMEGFTHGELEGIGRWSFYEGRETAAVYEWNVRTTRPWMNVLAPLARPVFVRSHDLVMRRGAEGLARLLATRVTTS